MITVKLEQLTMEVHQIQAGCPGSFLSPYLNLWHCQLSSWLLFGSHSKFCCYSPTVPEHASRNTGLMVFISAKGSGTGIADGSQHRKQEGLF
jgi:hypothetical protein